MAKLMWNLRVLFASNVETTKSKTQNPFLEIDCRGTELVLKFLSFLGVTRKTIQKFHI
jgi:hypothetical protein